MRKLARFFEEKKIAGYQYLNKNLRFKILNNVRKIVINAGATFGVCREDLPDLNVGSCDGSHLLRG
jgi:hypothetical protein